MQAALEHLYTGHIVAKSFFGYRRLLLPCQGTMRSRLESAAHREVGRGDNVDSEDALVLGGDVAARQAAQHGLLARLLGLDRLLFGALAGRLEGAELHLQVQHAHLLPGQNIKRTFTAALGRPGRTKAEQQAQTMLRRSYQMSDGVPDTRPQLCNSIFSRPKSAIALRQHRKPLRQVRGLRTLQLALVRKGHSEGSPACTQEAFLCLPFHANAHELTMR